MDLGDIMSVDVVCVESPLDFKLVEGVVFVYGGVFHVDNGVLDLDECDDLVFKCLDLDMYNLTFCSFPCILCSRNLYKGV